MKDVLVCIPCNTNQQYAAMSHSKIPGKQERAPYSISSGLSTSPQKETYTCVELVSCSSLCCFCSSTRIFERTIHVCLHIELRVICVSSFVIFEGFRHPPLESLYFEMQYYWDSSRFRYDQIQRFGACFGCDYASRTSF